VGRTLRNDCLDHVRILNERHRHAVLAAYVAYDNAARPPRRVALAPPLPAVRSRAAPPEGGAVHSRPVLGGLHHRYQRAA